MSLLLLMIMDERMIGWMETDLAVSTMSTSAPWLLHCRLHRLEDKCSLHMLVRGHYIDVLNRSFARLNSNVGHVIKKCRSGVQTI